ncbi:hypothetical protein MGH68_14040 [Erysipelothrix sp. D19-032]
MTFDFDAKLERDTDRWLKRKDCLEINFALQKVTMLLNNTEYDLEDLLRLDLIDIVEYNIFISNGTL